MERNMHELSIAMSIVEMAQEEAERRDVRIDAVYLELGLLSGVVAEALLFSYEIACSETRLEGSRLVIHEVPIEVYCTSCDAPKNIELDAVVLLSGVRDADGERDSRKRALHYGSGDTR
jgi:hydrogenase nickel incorporation protein HypA/HybF